MSEPSSDESKRQRPPFFQTWKGMYWLVLGTLLFQIIVFYAITLYYK